MSAADAAGKLTATIDRCSACGSDHKNIPLIKLEPEQQQVQGMTYTHKTTCPQTSVTVYVFVRT